MLNGCDCQNGGGGFWVSILFLLLYFFVACEHLGRLFQPSLKYLQVKGSSHSAVGGVRGKM